MDFADHTGYVSLFNGKTLTGWDGQPGLWRVEDGAIVGETKPEMFPRWAFPNTFLILNGVTAKDFDLKLEIKVEKEGSGIQYRSTRFSAEQMKQKGGPRARPALGDDTAPQADFWYPVNGRKPNSTAASSTHRTTTGARLCGGARWCSPHGEYGPRGWWERSATCTSWGRL